MMKYREEDFDEWHSEDDIIVSGDVSESTLGVGTPVNVVKDMDSRWVNA